MPFRLIQDDDGHWYVIDVGNEAAFYAWCAAMQECVATGDYEPKRVNGPRDVVFDSWRGREDVTQPPNSPSDAWARDIGQFLAEVDDVE